MCSAIIEQEIKETLQSYLDSEKSLLPFPKEEREISVALIFPDLYEIGLPNLGIQVLYRELNSRLDISASRAYLPGEMIREKLIKNRIPLFCLEDQKPIREHDILCFTVPFEELYTNVLQMMELAQISVFRRDRSESDPVVIAGGPCPSYNPEPLADFMDAFVIGEGEDVVHEIIDVFRIWKRSKGRKKRLLMTLSAIRGIYVPELYSVVYGDDGTIERIIPSFGNKTPPKVKRRWVKDLDVKPAHSMFITARTVYAEPTFSIQVSRGCGEHCRFCYVGYGLRRARRIKPDIIVELVKKALKHAKVIKLFYEALTPEHSDELFSKLEELIDTYGIQLRLGSARADMLTETMVRVSAKARQDIIVVAPEVAEGHLRRFINKDKCEDVHILRAVDLATKWGIPNFGLYLMIGVPTEREEDIEALADLIRKVRHRMDIDGNESGVLEVHINPFFPKPFTPLQWSRMEDIGTLKGEFERIISILREEYDVVVEHIQPETLFVPRDTYRHDIVIKTVVGSKMCYSQPPLSRGDRRMSEVLYRAYKMGDTIDAWEKAFRDTGIDPEIYFREKSLDEVLPWAVIDTGVRDEYLKKEYVRALMGIRSEPCGDEKCRKCGVCE